MFLQLFFKNDSKTDLSCLHGLTQLICHRKCFYYTDPSPSELQRIIRLISAIWPIAFGISMGPSSDVLKRSQEGSNVNSSCPSSSSCGEVSDGSGVYPDDVASMVSTWRSMISFSPNLYYLLVIKFSFAGA